MESEKNGISLELSLQIIEMVNVGIFIWNLQTDEVIYSKEWARIVGYELDELPQTVSTWEKMLLPEDLKIADDKIQLHLSGKTPYYEAEFRMVKKDGTIIWGHDKGKVTEYTSDGKPLVLCGVLQDITNIKKTQDELAHRTKMLDIAIEVAQIGTWDWDLTDDTVKYNDEYLKMLGYSPSDINGSLQEWEDMNHPDDLPNTLRLLDDYIGGKSDHYECETRMLHKDGHYVWTKETGKIVKRDKYGKVTQMIGGHMNIDVLKISQLELEQTLKSLENHREGLEKEISERTKELVSRDRLSQAVNKVSQALMSINAEDVFDKNIVDSLKHIIEAYSASEVALWRHIEVGGKKYMSPEYIYNDEVQIKFDLSDSEDFIKSLPNDEEFAHIKPDGNLLLKYYMLSEEQKKEIEKEAQVTYNFLDVIPKSLRDVLTGFSDSNYGVILSPVYVSDNLFGFITISNNKEDVKYTKAQEDMLNVIGNLYADSTRKNEMDKQLRLAHEEALLSTQAKTNFLANMSHEIRTPLNAILGMAEIILRESMGRATEEYALEIKSASENLLSIINDILDISKIESGKLEIINVDYYIASMLSDVINLSRVRLTNSPVQFTTFIHSKVPALLYGDELRIKQILLNILSNAIKFTKKGNIHFSVTSEHENGRAVLKFSVKDTGMGIREEDLQRLFMQFERVDTKKNRNIEGTGLGLAITKQLCEMMGGSISVSSEFGVGSIFTVTIPQTYDNYMPIVGIVESKNVLVYEARTKYAHYLKKSLENIGSKCALCDNQSDLFNYLNAQKFDYLFVPAVHFQKIKSLKQELNRKFEIIIMTDPGDTTIYRDATSANLPISCMQLSSILGSGNLFSHTNEKAENFVAPHANVLVVDDNIVNLKVAKGLMAPYKFTIDTAINGALAVEKIKNNIYDLVFMDHMMPEMDGVDATNIIRKLPDEYYKNLPIIALTANALVGAKELFVKEGMNDFLAKPIEIKKLNSALLKWLPKDKICFIKKQTESKEPEKKAENSLQIEGVDTAHGITLIGGDIADYKDVLKSFYNDGILKLDTIKNSFDSENKEAYRIEVHAVKSAAASIGAKMISEQAKHLESAAIKDDRQFIEQNTTEFLSDYKQVLDNIMQSFENEESGSQIGEGDIAVLKDNLIQLEAALDMLDIDVIENTLNMCTQYTWQGKINELLEEIRTNTQAFEYYNASALIADIKNELGKSGL